MRSSVEELGYQRALLFQGFACFARDQALRLGLDRLYFVTREGVFFMAVYQSLFAEPTGGPVPLSVQLIEASRQSTFGPSVSAGGVIELTRLWNLYPRITPLAFLKSLNLEVAQFGPYFRWCDLALDAPIEQPWRDGAFLKVTTDQEFVRLMHESLERDRELAMGYFSPIFAGQERIGLVEIGWQGSIQDNLALLFPEKLFHGFYLGLAVAKNPSLPNSSKIAFGPDRNLSGGYRALLNAVNVLEFICLSPGGSVARYGRGEAGRVVAVCAPHPSEDELIERCSELFQRGVIQAGSIARGHELIKSLKEGSLRQRALFEWGRILSQPHPELVRNYFRFKSNEEFGLGEFRDQSHTPTWSTIAASPVSSRSRKQLIRYLTYSQWAEGTRARRDLAFMKRWVLYGLMRFALITKAIMHGRRAGKVHGAGG